MLISRNLKAGVFLLLSVFSYGQDGDLLSELEDEEIVRSSASFKTTRIVNSQSLETTHQGVLDFRISHRFGLLSGGLYELFGLDQATMRLGFDYGINDRFTIGIGRSTYEKTYDGFVKYRLLWQTEGSEKMPISVVLYSNASVNTLRFPNPGFEYTFDLRLNYTNQILIGRKFSDRFTAQLMPTLVHRNLVATRDEKNTVFLAGAGGRLKLSQRVALNAEYFYALPDQLTDQIKNSLSLGFDIETGGHVFQLHFSNSQAIVDKGFLTETRSEWLDGDIYFGFTISRVFDVGPKKKND